MTATTIALGGAVLLVGAGLVLAIWRMAMLESRKRGAAEKLNESHDPEKKRRVDEVLAGPVGMPSTGWRERLRKARRD